MGQHNSGNCEEMPEYNYSAFEINGSGSDHGDDKNAQTNTNPPQQNKNGTNWQRRWTVILYSITTILLFSDQNLLAPNLSQAAEEFGFDDNERDKKLGGDIALAFFVLGAPASLLVGCMADSNSISRSFLFGLIVLIGEGACFLTYFTTDYTGLYVTRALTGFSVGGALPLLSSVLGDWYKPEERGTVMASVGIGTGVGIALGQGISGFIGPLYGWRVPFLIVSIPAMFVALLVMTTVVDPVRGGSEKEAIDGNITANKIDQEADFVDDAILINEPLEVTMLVEVGSGLSHMPESPSLGLSHRSPSPPPGEAIEANDNQILKISAERSMDESLSESDVYDNGKSRRWKKCLSILNPSSYTQHLSTTKELLSSKTVLLTLLQGAPGCIPWGIVNTFLNDYLSEDCGMTVQAATTTILFFGFGNFFGILIGGAGGDYLYKRDAKFPALLSGTMAILGCFPFWILINTTKVVDGEISFGTGFRICFIAVLAGIGSGVTGPIVKATLQNVTIPHARGQAFALLNTFDDFGRGLGPVFVAGMIISLGGRQAAFNIGVGGWILCGLFNICIFFTVKSDEARTRSVFLERYSIVDSSNISI
jgi:MFS family permease